MEQVRTPGSWRARALSAKRNVGVTFIALPIPLQILDVVKPHATLSNWLYVVASLRLLSVVLGYTYPKAVFGQNLETQLFDIANPKAGDDKSKAAKAGKQFTPLTGRTFAVWTAVTCIVCVLTAQEPENTGLLKLCCSTFAVAMAYFALELTVYKTASLSKVLRPAVFASVSAVWTYNQYMAVIGRKA